jgi:hypothetical protein
MASKLVGAAVCAVVVLSGCGAQATTPARTTTARVDATRGAVATTGSSAVMTAASETLVPPAPATPTLDLAALPSAPWSAPAMSAHEAPRQILTAWENADNRDHCAPLATRSMGVAEGAHARTSELSGGWLVEFDHPGLPGVDRQGRECDTCGRSVVGIAGTSIAPDALIAPDADTLSPTYSDGSHAEIEVVDADGESVASVTFTIAGQSCVYEVWSLLGPDHLAEVVSGLRLVEPPAVRGGAIASR